jgi:L-lactate dehydrogenase complex protein LldF
VHYLAESQRQHTRPYFLNAEAGMTGANFAVAETGTVVVCTNEGNADLSVNLPKLYIASHWNRKNHSPYRASRRVRSDALAERPWLADHAAYVALPCPREDTEMHIVLVDNGRSERLGMAISGIRSNASAAALA